MHSRLRVMGAIERGEVDVGPLLGRGASGRVYKCAPAWWCDIVQLLRLAHLLKCCSECTLT